jgi:putative Holliday junction resolvase
MRTLGLDIGEKRIGVAISDPSGRVATPLSVLDARAVAADIGSLLRIIEDYEVQSMVVGLPLTMSGDEGAQAREVRRTAEMLSLRLGMAVAYQDERLTSKSAERAMSEAGADSRARRGRVDMVAAALLLQTYLDAQAAS